MLPDWKAPIALLTSAGLWLQVNQVKAKLARIRRDIEAANTAAEAGDDRPVVTNAVAEVELI